VSTLPAPADSYFVCATPRTGSSLLLGLLSSTGVAGRPQAYFREPDEPLYAARWGLTPGPGGRAGPAAFLRAARAAGRTPNGVFGAKLMWGAQDRLTELCAHLHPRPAGDHLALLRAEFGDVRFVHLRREDTLAQAVSWLRAEQTGVWFEGGDGEIAGGGGDRPAPAPVFVRDDLTRLLRTAAAHDAAWQQWFGAHGVEPLRLTYEQLDADPAGTTTAVLRHLGLSLPAGRRIAPRHRRQADALNEEWMRRYRAGGTQG
jgi:LPS sulfotransferase NodH